MTTTETPSSPAALDFAAVLLECGSNAEFVKQYQRITNRHLPSIAAKETLNKQQETYAAQFAAFVYETVWLRMPRVDIREANAPKEGAGE